MSEQSAAADAGASGETPSGSEGGNRLERRNAELASQNKDLKTQLSQLQATVKELEGLKTEKSSAEEKLAKEQGRWESILEKRDKQIEELTGKVQTFESEVSTFRNKEFERQVLERISPKSQAKPAIVHGTYLAYLESRGVPRFPEDRDVEKAAKERLKGMSEFAPELFGSGEPTGGTPRNKPDTGGERRKVRF